MPDEETWKLAIHLNGGGKLDTIVTEAEIEDADASDIDDLIDSALHQEGKPRWVTLGSVKFHPQAITAIELEEM